MAYLIDVTTTSRPQILSKLEELKKNPEVDIDKISKETWVNYARHERPKRMLRIFLMLLEVAARPDSERYKNGTTYKEIQIASGQDSFHECLHILKLIGELCKRNDWPKYAVFIKQEGSGRVGDGFFADYGISGSLEYKILKEKEFEEECYSKSPPTLFEIISRVQELIYLKDLGRV